MYLYDLQVNSFQRSILEKLDTRIVQQTLKWVVYTLLLINFGLYVAEDWARGLHTLSSESTWLDISMEYATTLDTIAWLLLIVMLELETHAIPDARWRRWMSTVMTSTRIVCYMLIGHTLFAYADTVIQYEKDRPVSGVTSLCQLQDKGYSHVYNLTYTEITAANCAELSQAVAYFNLGNDSLVVDAAGLALERRLAWADVIEILTWLLILLAIEVLVQLQEKRMASGQLVHALNRGKLALYLVLFGLALYWAGLGHWLYTWDTFLWIGGFTAIEMNLSEWRDELLQQSSAVSAYSR